MAEVVEMVLAQLVAEQARHLPDLPVLTFVNVLPNDDCEEQRRTFREVHDNGQALAKALIELGVRRDDKVALMAVLRPAYAQTCSDPDDASQSLKESVNYRSAAPDPPQRCQACAFFAPSSPAGCGRCQILSGPVDAARHCDSFTKKT
ncbi:MAG: hypothetical protein ABW049_01610 [Spongiibacteraceae bacterium]